jgi:predicted AlkP superfamily pyrophosphatase or phosphodiesterase
MVLGTILSSLLSALSANDARVKHVFIVSIDGGKPAVIAQSQMPTLQSLVAKGAVTWDAQTIMPSITLPSHTSMLTGVTPLKHHILWNDWKPEEGLVKVPTIFALAKAQGLSTAMFIGKAKFKHLNVPGTVDLFIFPIAEEPIDADGAEHAKAEAKPVAAVFAEALRGGLRTNLTFIHFSDTDTVGHKFGWGSPEQVAAFATVDAALKTVVNAIRDTGLAESSVVIVTADHGGHDKTHGLNIPDDMTIPWIAYGQGVQPGFKLTEPVNTCDTAATALWLLGIPIPDGFDGHPVTTAFSP